MNQARGPLAPGAVVGGRYRIVQVLGQGGFGIVYEAQHIELGRTVALKTLSSGHVRDDTMVERFLQEARTAASIGHRGIIQVFDLGRDGDGAYIAMEKLEGEDLAERIARVGAFEERAAAMMTAQIADAVAAAHAQGVIHRDLKPHNVFIQRRGRVEEPKILDFGVAKLVGKNLTVTGQTLGTPSYMPPEQLRGTKGVDHRADIYAMGAILYQMLTGRLPFEAPSHPELVLKIVSEPPTPIASHRPGVSPELSALVMRAMAKDPAARFGDAREMSDALVAFANAPASAAPAGAWPQRWPLLLALVLAFLGVGTLGLLGAGAAGWLVYERQHDGGAAEVRPLRLVAGPGWTARIPVDWVPMEPEHPNVVGQYGEPEASDDEGRVRLQMNIGAYEWPSTIDRFAAGSASSAVQFGASIDRSVASTLAGRPAREQEFTVPDVEGTYIQIQRSTLIAGHAWMAMCVGEQTDFDTYARPTCDALLDSVELDGTPPGR